MQKKTIKLCIGKFFVVIVCALSLWVSPAIVHSQATGSTFIVNSISDKADDTWNDGNCWTGDYLSDNVPECTLRAAIEQANMTSARDTIIFAISGTGPHRIQIATPLPDIMEPVVINGYTQPGATPNTNPLDKGNNAKLMIILDGSKLDVNKIGLGVNGLVIKAGNSEVRGLVIQLFYHTLASEANVYHNGTGIVLVKKGGNLIKGNFIGTTFNGILPMPNATGILVASPGNRIEGNLISGNLENGIHIGSKRSDNTFIPGVSGNKIQGNYIGTTKHGNIPLGNGAGVRIVWGPSSNTIGGMNATQRNVISGNRYSGILIHDSAGGSNEIQGNFIGTDMTGSMAVSNYNHGILVLASDTIITANVISGNGTTKSSAGCGIKISGDTVRNTRIESNKIGTDATGTKALPNQIHGIELQNTQENTVQSNLISGNDWSGVTIVGLNAKFNIVSSNKIGTNMAGDASLGNTEGGVAIFRGSENIIDDNLISGNKICGVFIKGSMAVENMIVGNKIGTNEVGDKRLPNAYDGIYIKHAPENFVGGSNLTDRNIISGNNRDGIRIVGEKSTYNYIRGNYIGIAKDGTTPLPNIESGVYIENAPENVIGGTLGEERNIISGNFQNGIVITGANAVKNKVQGNYIGTDKDGVDLTGKIGNSGNGVVIDGATENIIGGSTATTGLPPGNIISNNWLSGIHIKGTTAGITDVEGNLIGRDKNDAALGNGEHGILIEKASGNQIGAASIDLKPMSFPPTANVISSNMRDGVRINGDDAKSNFVRGNKIYENGGLGINLVGRESDRIINDDVTPNDSDDSDNGSNTLLNFPVGVTAFYDGVQTHISGILPTEKPEKCQVDIYANKTIDASGFGEGEIYVDSGTPNKQGIFHVSINGQLPYPFLSATATGPTGSGSTSEFSPVYADPKIPGIVDSDGDGLPDEWEIKGIDFNGDGNFEYDLKKVGAKWNHKDIFVEIDYMSGKKPEIASLMAIQDAFNSAPVPNLDGQTGVSLHCSLDEEIPLNIFPYFNYMPGALDDFWDLKKLYFGLTKGPLQGKSPEILGAHSLVYRYSIFGNACWVWDKDQNKYKKEASGVSELYGNDFMITLDNWDYTNDGGKLQVEAGTFMHELGHTLGLNHGGPMPIGNYTDPTDQSLINFKPNYLSVMNYSFQTRRHVQRPLDYSRFALISLQENGGLDEKVGVDGAYVPNLWLWPETTFTSEKVISDSPTGTLTKCVFTPPQSTAGAIDWDWDSTIDKSPVKASIHDPENCHLPDLTNYITLEGRTDWDRLLYNFRASEQYFTGKGLSASQVPEVELSAEEARDLAAMSDSDSDGLSNADDNVPFVYNPDQTDSDGDGIGDAGELLRLTFSETSVPGDTIVTGTVSLLLPAPSEGALRLSKNPVSGLYSLVQNYFLKFERPAMKNFLCGVYIRTFSNENFLCGVLI